MFGVFALAGITHAVALAGAITSCFAPITKGDFVAVVMEKDATLVKVLPRQKGRCIPVQQPRPDLHRMGIVCSACGERSGETTLRHRADGWFCHPECGRVPFLRHVRQALRQLRRSR